MNDGRILVDANALSDLFVGEADFRLNAESLRRKFPVWTAPSLCRYEFGNVLRTYVRLGRKSDEAARSMLEVGLSLLTPCEEPAASMILEVANSCNLTFYDATYVACARACGLTLYTRDGDILKYCPDVARRISDG